MATAAYVNGYRAFDFNDLSGGLNLRDKADVVDEKQAIDVLNVTFSERGAIRQRQGYDDLGNTDLAARVTSLSPFYNITGLRQLVAGLENGTLVALNTSGQVVTTSPAGTAGRPYVFARFGDPTHEYLYAANGDQAVRRYNGAAWGDGATLATVNGTAGQAMPRAGAITVGAQHPGSTSGTNASNRLIATAYGSLTNAGPGGTESTPSRVHFSNAGQPEQWETDGDPGIPGTRLPRGRNMMDLTPGDGEQIMAAVTWRELVFVFKETKFFVLWGEGQGSTGTPTFQFREVVNSIGLASPQAISIGRDGVYFFNRRGVYRTSGGDPVLLSDIIAPMWSQDPDAYFRSEPINLAQLDRVRALWHMERFYLAIPTGSRAYNDRVLVYDTQHEWWTLYDMPVAAITAFRSSSRPELHFGYSTGPVRVGHQILEAVTDRGQPITSRWRSGWGDYGSTQVKTIRETKLWGTGAVMVGQSSDYYREQQANLLALFSPVGDQWTYGALTIRGGTYAELGAAYPTYEDLDQNERTYGVIERATLRRAQRAIVFSTQFTNSPESPSWAIHRVARHLREVREPSVGPV